MKLEHYSDSPGIDQIDPNYHGSGVSGAESKRKVDPNFVGRSYHYIQGTKPEPSLGSKPYKYLSEVDDSKIYDYAKDPHQLKTKSKSEWNPNKVDPTLYEKNIKDAGFHGFINSAAPGMENVVATFHPIKPQSVVKKSDKMSDDLKKGKNAKEEKKRIFGSDANAPRISDKRMKMMQIIKNYTKTKHGLDMVTAAGKREQSGELRDEKGIEKQPFDVYTPEGHAKEKELQSKINAINDERAKNNQKPIKRVDPKPDWQSGNLETQPSPDAAVHEVAHLIHEKEGQDLPEMQRRMDRSWGESQMKYGHMQQKKTEGEIQPQSMENPLRRRMGLPANKGYKNARPMEEHDRAVEQSIDNTGPRFVRGVKPGKNPQSVDYDRQSRLMSDENRTKFDMVDRGELRFDKQKGWVPGTDPNAKINQRARAASQDPSRKDVKTLMRSEDNDMDDLKKSDKETESKSKELKDKYKNKPAASTSYDKDEAKTPSNQKHFINALKALKKKSKEELKKGDEEVKAMLAAMKKPKTLKPGSTDEKIKAALAGQKGTNPYASAGPGGGRSESYSPADSKTHNKTDYDVDSRMDRIKSGLSKINALMAQLKEKKGETGKTGLDSDFQSRRIKQQREEGKKAPATKEPSPDQVAYDADRDAHRAKEDAKAKFKDEGRAKYEAHQNSAVGKFAERAKQAKEQQQKETLGQRQDAVYKKIYGSELSNHRNNIEDMPIESSERIPGSDHQVHYMGKKGGSHYFSAGTGTHSRQDFVAKEGAKGKMELTHIPRHVNHWDVSSEREPGKWTDLDTKKAAVDQMTGWMAKHNQKGIKAAMSRVKASKAFAEASGKPAKEASEIHPKDFGDLRIGNNSISVTRKYGKGQGMTYSFDSIKGTPHYTSKHHRELKDGNDQKDHEEIWNKVVAPKIKEGKPESQYINTENQKPASAQGHLKVVKSDESLEKGYKKDENGNLVYEKDVRAPEKPATTISYGKQGVETVAVNPSVKPAANWKQNWDAKPPQEVSDFKAKLAEQRATGQKQDTPIGGTKPKTAITTIKEKQLSKTDLPPPPAPPQPQPPLGGAGSQANVSAFMSGLNKDDAPHASGSPEDKAHDIVEEHQSLKGALSSLSGKDKMKSMMMHLKDLKSKKDLRSPENQAVGQEPEKSNKSSWMHKCSEIMKKTKWSPILDY